MSLPAAISPRRMDRNASGFRSTQSGVQAFAGMPSACRRVPVALSRIWSCFVNKSLMADDSPFTWIQER